MIPDSSAAEQEAVDFLLQPAVAILQGKADKQTLSIKYCQTSIVNQVLFAAKTG